MIMVTNNNHAILMKNKQQLDQGTGRRTEQDGGGSRKSHLDKLNDGREGQFQDG